MRSAVEIAPAGSRPAIRLRPVPRYDPPFDDELAPQAWPSAQQLALEWPRPASTGRPRRAGTGPAGATGTGGTARGVEARGVEARGVEARAPGHEATGVPGPGGTGPVGYAGSRTRPAGHDAHGRWSAGPGPGRGQLAVPAAAPVVAGASGDAKLAVKRFVHMCVEVLNGHRPAAHLRRVSLPAEAAEVVAQGLAGARRVAEMRRPRRPGDGRPHRPSPVAVLRVNLCEPRRGAVEVAVALVTGERTWAMAFRLEFHHDAWCATTLRLI
ncbi:hypothetical protein FHX34_107331 [Actinoplanes teichomyceticus]|uniref:Uncharacterized protein n=1 Tax=Actinoplanes teichomyceticus TaxID=1867 RepID=A0A561VGU4_ACTTI|nr:hypothetical protein FHX34_107331 [Actinoplanes teichomyceticus]